MEAQYCEFFFSFVYQIDAINQNYFFGMSMEVRELKLTAISCYSGSVGKKGEESERTEEEKTSLTEFFFVRGKNVNFSISIAKK